MIPAPGGGGSNPHHTNRLPVSMPTPYLAVCAMHKLEAARLHEWIEYHLLVGFEYFYLFDNNDSDDGSEKVTRPYVEAGKATVIRVKGNYPDQQIGIYQWVCKQRPANWIAFIDIDEFVLPITDRDVRTIVQRYENHAGLAISWRCFGTSNHKSAPKYLCEAMTRASAPDFFNNQHVKCIVRPERVTRCLTPHQFAAASGFNVVNENHQPVAGSFMNYTDSTIVINHYMLRSEEEYQLKLKRGRGDAGKPYGEDFFDKMNRNEMLETRLLDRFGAEVRRRCEACERK